jgi:hemerythrin-like domain-containing protein
MAFDQIDYLFSPSTYSYIYLYSMAKEIKPIKRSKQLTPLSKDHHEGLLFAWKIKQGLKNGADIKLIAQYVQWFWKNYLQEHFWEEEQILVPHLPPDNELVKQMVDEHHEIEAMVHINENIVDDALLLNLAKAIDDHIRFEERQLFPYAENTIPEKELNLIYDQLSKKTAQCEKWGKEFWIVIARTN